MSQHLFDFHYQWKMWDSKKLTIDEPGIVESVRYFYIMERTFIKVISNTGYMWGQLWILMRHSFGLDASKWQNGANGCICFWGNFTSRAEPMRSLHKNWCNDSCVDLFVKDHLKQFKWVLHRAKWHLPFITPHAILSEAIWAIVHDVMTSFLTSHIPTVTLSLFIEQLTHPNSSIWHSFSYLYSNLETAIVGHGQT